MPELVRAASREVVNMMVDSRLWGGLKPRADDIIVATYPKCGTTWTQRIVDLLVFQSPEPRRFGANSPWLDATFFAPHAVNLANLEGQTHRRYIKSHLPFDALPIYDTVKYIHTARDGRDGAYFRRLRSAQCCRATSNPLRGDDRGRGNGWFRHRRPPRSGSAG